MTICMIQAPDCSVSLWHCSCPPSSRSSSSAMSPSGTVMIREVNPLPAAVVIVATMFAPKISSLALVVVAAPLLAVALLPLAAAFASSAVTPRYSRMRTSG